MLCCEISGAKGGSGVDDVADRAERNSNSAGGSPRASRDEHFSGTGGGGSGNSYHSEADVNGAWRHECVLGFPFERNSAVAAESRIIMPYDRCRTGRH